MICVSCGYFPVNFSYWSLPWPVWVSWLDWFASVGIGSLLGGIVLMLLLTPFIESFITSPAVVADLVLVNIGWMLDAGILPLCSWSRRR